MSLKWSERRGYTDSWEEREAERGWRKETCPLRQAKYGMLEKQKDTGGGGGIEKS